MPESIVKNVDCMIAMRDYPDKFFDLAIVDPDYGIGENWKKDRFSKFYTHNSTYKNASIPPGDYFNEVFRLSKHQIIWGGNYYTDFLPARQSWIVWNKNRSFKDSHMAECEFAWTSFNIPARIVNITWNGFIRAEPRYGTHPHEKPVGLYKWILADYLSDHLITGKILDTHLGSGSSRIAAYDMGFDFTGFEIDKDYFEAQEKRFQQHTAQLKLFTDMRNNRKPVKRRQENYCIGNHKGPWTFEKTASGTKRTCSCGYSITEIGRHVEIHKGKRDQLIRSKGRVS